MKDAMEDPEDWSSKIWIPGVVCQLNTMHSVRAVAYYLVQNEDCSLGDSATARSEGLMQRGTGEGPYIRFWWRGSLMQSSTYFTKTFLLVTRSWWHHKGIQRSSTSVEVQGLGSRNRFLNTSVHLRSCPTGFPGAQMPRSPRWAPRGGRSTGQGLRRGRWRRPLCLLLFSCWQTLLARANL